MAPFRRSARAKKTRSRVSATPHGRRRIPFPRRLSSRRTVFQRSDAVTFGREEGNPDVEYATPAQTNPIGRRRSDRIRRLSMLKTPTMLSPRTSTLDYSDALDTQFHESPRFTLDDIELVPGDKNKIFESMFGDVFEHASLVNVDVEQCISISELRVRPLHNFGISRAINLLRGKSVGLVTGHVCVGKFPVITELPGEYHAKVLSYFSEKGRDKSLSQRFITSKTIYHVVNGGYEHEARWRLIDGSGYQFTGIKWRAIQIPWQSPNILRGIAMMSSQLQKQEFVVDLSFADEMVHLRRVIDDYLSENAIVLTAGKPLPRGFSKEISNAFCGGKDYSNNTLRHLISVAAKMSLSTTLMMRQVIDEECAVVSKSFHGKAYGVDSDETNDTRAFRKLLNSKTLRGTKTFLGPETSEEDRRNALYRLRYIAQEKGIFKGVDSSDLDEQVALAIAGRKAIQKFRDRVLRKDSWPAGVKPLLQNILWTTKLDLEVAENQEEPHELLQVLKHKYVACAGGEGGNRVEQYEKFVLDQARNADKTSGVASAAVLDPIPSASSDITSAAEAENDMHSGDTEATNVIDAEDQSRSDSAHASINPDSAVPVESSGLEFVPVEDVQRPYHEEQQQPEPDVLQQCGVAIHGITWEEYNRTVLNEQALFDVVISDPFQKAAAAPPTIINEEQRISFVEFVKKALVPGGYVFLIVPQLEATGWLQSIEECGLKPEGLFTLIKDPDSVQRTKGRSFQNLIEVAVIGRKTGRHPTNFAMDVLSPYCQLPHNRYKRRAPVIDNISPPSNRLCFPRSKTQVRTGEKSPALVWELMKTFCPPGGNVLDPYAGPMTTGIACIQSGRRCILLESDARCIFLAEARLREFAAIRLKDSQGESMIQEFESDKDLLDIVIDQEESCEIDGHFSCSNCCAGTSGDAIMDINNDGGEPEDRTTDELDVSKEDCGEPDSIESYQENTEGRKIEEHRRESEDNAPADKESNAARLVSSANDFPSDRLNRPTQDLVPDRVEVQTTFAECLPVTTPNGITSSEAFSDTVGHNLPEVESEGLSGEDVQTLEAIRNAARPVGALFGDEKPDNQTQTIRSEKNLAGLKRKQQVGTTTPGHLVDTPLRPQRKRKKTKRFA